MKFLSAAFFAVALLASTTSSHSWLECSDDASNYDDLKAHPDTANLIPKCNGYPRNKVDNGDWIKESTYYLWDLASQTATNEQGGRHACHPKQRQPTYPNNAPAAKAKAGQALRLRFWGNGHASYTWGRPLHHDPGLVRVYWAGEGKEIVLASELTVDKLMAESNFSADAVTVPKDGNAPNDKANWMTLQLPVNIPQGRNMFTWTWAPIKDDFEGGWRNQYTTCFDIFVEGKTDNTNAPPPPPPVVKPVEDPSAKIKEQCAKQCFKGGMTQFPCSGDCPPCRYGENCFEYGTDGKCPSWAGGFDCKKGQPI